jgi:hypothetical protein
VSRKYIKDKDKIIEENKIIKENKIIEGNKIIKENKIIIEGKIIKDKDLELISTKLIDLKLRKGSRFYIRRLLRIIKRVFYYLYKNITRVSEEFIYISYKYTRYIIYLVIR